MTESSDQSSRTLLNSYIEKTVSAQSSIQDLQREITRLRQDARADGFNMEAVHQLGLILAKSPHDNGAGLLRDIFQYAHQTGVELENVTVSYDTPAKAADDTGNDASVSVSRFIDTKPFFDGRLSLVAQVALGFAVAGAFLWLLQ